MIKFLLVALVCVFGSICTPNLVPQERQKDDSGDMTKLLLEKASEAYTLATAAEAFEEACLWSRKILDLEGAKSKNQGEQAGGAKKHLARIEEITKLAKQRWQKGVNNHKSGLIKDQELQKLRYGLATVEFYYLEAAILWTKAKSKE